MKLHCANYASPIDTEGNYQDVYIEDVSYKLEAHKEVNKPYFFQIDFEMYHFKNEKRVLLDKFQQSFLGTNEDLQQGKPTTNKKSIIKILNFVFDPEIPQFIEVQNPEYDENIPQIIEVENPDYDENIEGSLPIIEINNPEYKPEIISVLNPYFIPENGEVNMVHYLQTYGQLPDEYEVIQWGCATAEDAMQYFEGGNLDNPRLFITNPFARGWLLNTVQMKGFPITNFEFIG